MLKVSEDVEAVIGRKFATKYYISTLVRKYINEYNLSEYFSTTNDPMTRLYFVPDEKLKKIFGKEPVLLKGYTMSKYLSRHITEVWNKNGKSILILVLS